MLKSDKVITIPVNHFDLYYFCALDWGFVVKNIVYLCIYFLGLNKSVMMKIVTLEFLSNMLTIFMSFLPLIFCFFGNNLDIIILLFVIMKMMVLIGNDYAM